MFHSNLPVGEVQKNVLRGMLFDPRWTWRKVSSLDAAIGGVGPIHTRELLTQLGATFSDSGSMARLKPAPDEHDGD